MSEPVVIGEQQPPGAAPPVNPFAPPATHPPAGTRYQVVSNGIIYTYIANGYGSGSLDPQSPPHAVAATNTNRAPQIIRDPKTGRPLGYWDPDQPDAVIPFPDTQTNQPTPLGGGYVWNPAAGNGAGAVEELPPQQPAQGYGIHTAGNVTFQTRPDGSVVPVYTDRAAIAARQAELEDARARTQIAGQQADTSRWQAETAAQQGNLSAFNSYYNNLIAASQADETAQQRGFERDVKTLYDLPRQQMADQNQALLNQYTAAGQRGTYETGVFGAGRQAAADRVRTQMDLLPYKAGPQFGAEFAQRRQQEAAGQALTPYSQGAIMMPQPDLEAERTAGYREAGVTGPLPSFDDLLRRSPSFATTDPEELARLQRHLMLSYVPPAGLAGR